METPEAIVAELIPESPEGEEPGKAGARQALEARLVQLFTSKLERGSWETCRRTGARLGLLFFYGVRRRREIALANINLVFPGVSKVRAQQIARRSVQNFGMTFCELMRLRTATDREIQDYVELDGMEHVRAAFALGRGLLLETAHFGNWEMMGARLAQEFPMTAMSRPSSNSAIQNHMAAIREARKINVISKYDTARTALKVLRSKNALGIFADQWAGYHEPLLPMFGYPTRCVTALARLSLMSGAPIMVGFGIRRTPWLADGRIIARGFPAFTVQSAGRDAEAREAAVHEGTLRGLHIIESIVRQYPEQWLWLHRRWRAEDAAAARDGES
ncbi:MAG: lysophospholipid acyltransferase family protein [Armatimonadota bacterium]|nr:lysophospholipid acyltransferase family protein [Armatimonadota bacterium]